MTQTPAFDMVLFGGTGDLVMRKILPALHAAHAAGSLHPEGRILALGRQDLDRPGYLALAATHGASRGAADWEGFAARIDYRRVDATRPEDFDALASALGGDRVTVFYLATSPALFAGICAELARVGLNGPLSRVVLEKPLGHDLKSSESINAAVGEAFAENQIYRIDHYLGKESVQNLMAIRFGNVLFEPLWRREWVQHVQITIAEDLGVEGRGDFYDATGALRDMVQNHLLQLVCMVAMEPPASLEADAIRDEKLKVLKALKPYADGDVAAQTVRGQYRAGAVAGLPVPGYVQEPAVAPGSQTETFVALKAEIANWRWAGVPFFLRTGKRMPQRVAEIVITFRDVPLRLFGGSAHPNRLEIRLQPDEAIRLHFRAKQPGDAMRLQSAYLNLDFGAAALAAPAAAVVQAEPAVAARSGAAAAPPRRRGSDAPSRRADAYERLLLDVIRGHLGLFMGRDELAAAWAWIEPILDAWERDGEAPRPYAAGTWGPPASTALLSRDGAAWHEEI